MQKPEIQKFHFSGTLIVPIALLYLQKISDDFNFGQ